MDGFSWRERDGVRWLSAELPGAEAAFTTRLGGAGEGSFDSLNLGLAVGDDPGVVIENRRRLLAALGREGTTIGFGRQVHGRELQSPPAAAGSWLQPQTGLVPEADGQIVRERDEAGLVFVADCVPIVLAGETGVGVLHGGWRGLAAGIVGAGAAAVEAESAAIGPSIGPCCYEVGEEVVAAFTPLGDGVLAGSRLDLWAAAEALLRRAGVEQVVSARLCTRCNPELFFSHRGAGPRTGRQAGLGWIEAAGG